MNEKTYFLGVRITDEERLALNLLASRWNVNQAEAARVCIRREAESAGLPDIGALEALPPTADQPDTRKMKIKELRP